MHIHTYSTFPVMLLIQDNSRSRKEQATFGTGPIKQVMQLMRDEPYRTATMLKQYSYSWFIRVVWLGFQLVNPQCQICIGFH